MTRRTEHLKAAPKLPARARLVANALNLCLGMGVFRQLADAVRVF